MSRAGPGFFGKVRAHGDFVARRLAPPLRAGLDAWLQEALLRSRRDLGAAWLPAWLNSPLWRFALAPGVVGEHACVGVMMPSLDRVDRCFPLLIVLELAGGAPALAECIGAYRDWFLRLEDLALSTLDVDFSLDRFDAQLQSLEGAPRARYGDPVASPAPPAPWRVALDGVALPALADHALAGQSAWWTDGGPAVPPCLAVCPGLPEPARFAAFLDGRWEARGWRGS